MDPTNSQSNPDPALVLILGRIEGQLGTYIKFMETLQEKHDSLETRVRGLENAKFWLIGLGAAAGGILGFVVDLLK
ncbi:hypothetical protein [Brevundimonas sp. NPDC058933]|uniref:hypothetical protein n=1 Tax=Brevundimonas sp. NPDC058933 TaxID=3346673 RepID=UPI003BEEDACA